jgi:HEAT repeat protein
MTCAASPSGGKTFLLIFVFAAGTIGGAWWWTRPPLDPVNDGRHLSEWLTGTATYSGHLAIDARQLEAYGPAAVTWLAYNVEHTRVEHVNNRRLTFAKRKPLPFDKAPNWLRRLISDRLGGTRASPPEVSRAFAADALTLLGPKASAAVPALARTLESEDQSSLYHVACALHAIGPASWSVVQQALEHANKSARVALLSTLYLRVGSDRQPAPDAEVAHFLEVIAKASRDPDASVRFIAVDAIAVAHRKRQDLVLPESLMPELIRLLSDSEHSVRAPAAEAIPLFGAKAAPAIPGLIDLLGDENPRVRNRAAWALARVDVSGKRSTAYLRLMLHDSDPSCREEASKALVALGH